MVFTMGRAQPSARRRVFRILDATASCWPTTQTSGVCASFGATSMWNAAWCRPCSRCISLSTAQACHHHLGHHSRRQLHQLHPGHRSCAMSALPGLSVGYLRSASGSATQVLIACRSRAQASTWAHIREEDWANLTCLAARRHVRQWWRA